MTELTQDSLCIQTDVEKVDVGMYEAGDEDRSGFHVFNIARDQYHRAEVLQRTGAIDITCNLKEVIHGAMSANSDRYATLIVMEWGFQPRGSRRISEASIELLFETALPDSDIEVEKVSFEDTYSLMPTIQQETITMGGEATIGVEQFASLGLTGKWEKTISKTSSDAITLCGGKRLINNRPPNCIATWKLSENQAQRTGIPASLKIAMLVSRDDEEKFFCKLAFTCKTDLKTSSRGLFKKIPKDDPIIFQPNPNDVGTRPNNNVAYGNLELGSVNLNELCNVTFRTIITKGQKPWE
ncbi:hypothetical protein F4813DRAFT_372416 [Daldinia decipiens]|uniref:uncharacterized protein n=1 Tax=Daldinia decipiens TaxID=326647 RepID=UPI0020C4F526|nr:uncharacterized protein F4813DRAFT_372416 [Daldinia decipiens]KAI1654118.1 hypothetical protein F4813DRAFT_372416 [Daldinia decipiens]